MGGEIHQIGMSKEGIRKALAQQSKKTEQISGYMRAAVLLPLFERSGEYYLVFTKRTQTVNYHKGEVSFPGGRPHPGDASLLDTALREAWEEIGLPPKDTELLGELDDMPTYTTRFVISPFVASIPYPHQFTANPAEVDQIIEVPLLVLRDKKSRSDEWLDLGGKQILQYVYHYRDHIIWGATARIVKRFLEVVDPEPIIGGTR